MLGPRDAVVLREALLAADYTYDAVDALLGPAAHAALGRAETTAAERVTGGGTPLEILVRLWLLQLPVRWEDAERALPGLVDRLCTAGLLERSVAEVAARLDVRPYAADDQDLWITSDLTPGLDGAPSRMAADHVLGISPAATTLAALTVRRPVARALDLGTGCGVQSLHLSGHAGHVVATDVNPRALELTRFNAALNGVDLDVREGSFLAPVRGERFDLVVSNPPFVVSPATVDRLIYRDSGVPGDGAVEHLVRDLPAVMADGGTAQLMANWLVRRDQPWQERVAGWLDGAQGVDAWVLQRETADLPTYVELWLKDAGHHPSTGGDPAEFRRRYDTWLSWFEEQDAEGVGFGWVQLRSTGAADPDVRVEDWPYEVTLPLGDEVDRYFEIVDLLRRTPDDTLLGLRLRRPADVEQETRGVPGAEDPHSIVLRRASGVRRARRVDTSAAALVGACDGDLSLGQIRDALTSLGVAPPSLADVRDLVREGFLDVGPGNSVDTGPTG